jgi:hypothetical protein
MVRAPARLHPFFHASARDPLAPVPYRRSGVLPAPRAPLAALARTHAAAPHTHTLRRAPARPAAPARARLAQFPRIMPASWPFAPRFSSQAQPRRTTARRASGARRAA